MKSESPSPLRIPLSKVIGNQTRSYPFVRKGWDVEALVVNSTGEVGLRVYINRCPHLPLTLDIGTGSFYTKEGNELLCSNHGARFTPESGLCTWGPCEGHALIPIPFSLSEDSTHLEIHIDQIDRERTSRGEVMGEE